MTTTAPAPEYAAIADACGELDRSERGKLALTGTDAKELLQGQVTNDVESLSPGTGCYAAFLTPKGKMLGDVRILDAGEELLLDTERVALQNLFNLIRRSSVGYDVQLHKRTLECGLLSLIGPEAELVLAGTAASAQAEPAAGAQAERASGAAAGTAAASAAGAHELGENEHSHGPIELGGVPARAIRTDVGVDLLCDASNLEDLRNRLRAAGAVDVSEATAECLRIERGRPRYGVDLDDSVIPQEAGLNDRAVSFTKGCYVGQETVARLHYRGKPNRHLRGLRLSGSAAPGDEVRFGERVVGKLGSVAESPRLRWIALALIRREAPVGSTVSVENRGAHGAQTSADAQLVELPFG
jgi:folate-binding protein YgfZ